MYKKIRYIFRLIIAFIRRHFKFIFAGVLLSLVISYVIFRLVTLLPYFRTVKSIALVGRYTLSELPLAVLEKLSIGLTTLDFSGLPSAGISKSWSISEDGKIYTFDINTSLKWQDGTSIQSQDIQYQFRDAKISYPDNSKIQIALSDPFSPLPSLLSKPVFKISSTKNPSRHLIGIGQYRLKNIHYNGSYIDWLVLEPINSENRLPILKYYFFTTPSQAVTAFKLGIVNEVDDLTEIPEISTWPDVKVISRPVYNRFVGIFINTTDPIFSGQSGRYLRFALSYALPKESTSTRALGPISITSWAFNPQIKTYDYDLVKALDNLKKVEKKPEKLILSTVPAYYDQAKSIAKSWESLNIQTEVSVTPDIPSNFQLLLLAQALSADPDQYYLWHSTQESSNLTRLNNPRIDKLLEEGRKTYNLLERKKIYSDFQKYLVEEAPVIFLYYPHLYSIVK